MPYFFYKIRDGQGRLSEGVIEAESEEYVAGHLRKMGYTPVTIKERVLSLHRFRFIDRFLNKISIDDLIIFTQQLKTLQSAGIPLLTSLQAIEAQTSNRYFRDAIDKIYHRIESGKTLSDAMGEFPDIFSRIYVNMIRAGETGGILDTVLERIVNLYEHERELNMKIRQAMRYPLLVFIALSIAFLFAVLFIIPRFTGLFIRFGKALPLPTRILLWVYHTLTHYWLFMIILVSLLVVAVRRFIATRRGRYMWDSLKLNIPIFGTLSLKISMSHLTRILSLLSASGLPIINILEVIRDFIGNSVIAGYIDNIVKGINEGKGIAEPMKVSGLFPPIVVQMVKTGEETGRLDELLLKVSDYYDTQIDYMVKNLTVLVEPFLLLLLGIMVLVLALGIFLPMWNLISVFR